MPKLGTSIMMVVVLTLVVVPPLVQAQSDCPNQCESDFRQCKRDCAVADNPDQCMKDCQSLRQQCLANCQ